MSPEELEEFMSTNKLKNVAFDKYRFTFTFENNVTLEVTHDVEWDSSCWNIEVLNNINL